MDEREQRIVATAIELASVGGFENVRLRDVAASSGVALGTLYRHFRSKEDILVSALAQAVAELEESLRLHPAPGDTATERVSAFFRTAVWFFCSRANLSRAVVRALTSGEPELTGKLASFQANGARMIIAALRGRAEGPDERPATPLEAALADVLNHVWLAVLVAWAGGLHSEDVMIQKLGLAVDLLLRGARGDA